MTTIIFKIKLFIKIILKIKKSLINHLSYELWMARIMSDAMEYDVEPHIVDAWLDSNYTNHFGDKGEHT